MKRFFRAVCLVGLAVSAVIAFGPFSIASADRDGYHGDRHNRVSYKRAYRQCSHENRVGTHRFKSCMTRQGW